MPEEPQQEDATLNRSASAPISDAARREEEILLLWRERRVFEKTLKKHSPKGEFVFFDGPPFATGLPHYGHILAGTIKDVIPRFQTMQGYHVPRRWGWDCHGLPVEHEVEKELGFKTRKDVENYGLERFNAKAKETVMHYADDWRRIIPRMGRWVDMDNDYRTMDSPYTETVWWVFKTLHGKGLIYRGFKSMHLCPRCETTLSNFEVGQGYKEITDVSAFVKFKLLSETNTFLVAWTTTPWTLPGNVALAVRPDMDYSFVEITASNSREVLTGDTFIVGGREDTLKRVFGGESLKFDPQSRVGTFLSNGDEVAFSARRGVKGRDLAGQFYEPLFEYYANPRGTGVRLPNRDKAFKVYEADFVLADEGTGIVHIAPAFGEDDYNLAKKHDLPFIQHIQTDGTFGEAVVDFAGLSAKPKGNPRETDEKIANFLAAKGKLLKRESYTHEYPHCWRCETPLLNFASPSWFVNVAAMREKLVKENERILWVPEAVGKYRFGNWLAEAKDWAVSRTRFWGAPIPVWGCERCKTYSVVGSIDELRKRGAENITKVILLRHGESKSNTLHYLDDSPNTFPLTHEGKRKAKEAAEYILRARVDVIYSSPVRRARETAEIISRAVKKEVKIDERFREVDSGRWDGEKADTEALRREIDAYHALPPEVFYQTKRGDVGESWKDVERRMAEGLSDALRAHAGETVLIISHEGPIVHLQKAIGTVTLAECSSYFRKDRFEEFARPLTVYVDATTGKEFDLHRPHIDSVALTCETCFKESGSGRGLMHRIEEVFDCWFESGAMPYGQAHYPFETFAMERNGRPFDPVGGFWKKKSGFPADFIAEGLDQTRGWFYSMLVLGVGLFEKSPYRRAVVNGLILAENGAKMSKRLKNYPDPLDIVAKYGADSLRFYLLSSPAVRGEELRFSERGIEEVGRRMFNRLQNVLSFYQLYEQPSSMLEAVSSKLHSLSGNHVLDEWILARQSGLIQEVTEGLERYELDKAARPIAEFVDDLSTWYLRRSRERMKGDENDERIQALHTLQSVLSELAKVMAPFTPFFAEYLYQSVHNANITNGGNANTANKKESVHLEEWPALRSQQPTANSQQLLENMKEVRKIVSLALEARAKANIKVRQPLSSLGFKNKDLRFKNELLQLVKDEVNVKEVVYDENIQGEVELNTTITPELKEEGLLRELVRFIQEMRKKGGFIPGESATLLVAVDGPSRRFVEQNEQELSRAAALKNIVIQDSFEEGEPFQTDELTLKLSLTRV